MIVTIDGPAGSGKSSTAKAVAQKVGWHYLDSGSLYRTWTLLYIMGGADKSVFLEFLNIHSVTLSVTDTDTAPLLNNEPVDDEIRTAVVSEHVSTVAAMAEVREKVNAEMRRVVQHHHFIADGRDLGSVVFPNAHLKFFMVADLEERASRRMQELKSKGMDTDLQQIKQNIADRDQKDSSRDIAPLIKPQDAIEIDTTSLKFDEQVDIISSTIQKYKDKK